VESLATEHLSCIVMAPSNWWLRACHQVAGLPTVYETKTTVVVLLSLAGSETQLTYMKSLSWLLKWKGKHISSWQRQFGRKYWTYCTIN
jgi:hypothetical protein